MHGFLHRFLLIACVALVAPAAAADDLGRLSANPHAPDSIANPYGRYGSPCSPDSVNNPYGAGNPYAADSPTNPHGSGWRIVPGNQATPGAATTPRVVVPAAPAFSILNALDGPEDDHSGTDW